MIKFEDLMSRYDKLPKTVNYKGVAVYLTWNDEGDYLVIGYETKSGILVFEQKWLKSMDASLFVYEIELLSESLLKEDS